MSTQLENAGIELMQGYDIYSLIQIWLLSATPWNVGRGIHA